MRCLVISAFLVTGIAGSATQGAIAVGPFYAIDGGTYNGTSVDAVGVNFNGSSSSSYDGAIAQLGSSTTLAEVGDKITLTFRTEALSTNNNQTWNFRFGLFNSNGAAVTADNQTAQSDQWTGYFAIRHTTQSNSSNELAGGSGDYTSNSLFEQKSATSINVMMEGVGGGFGNNPTGFNTTDLTQLIARTDGDDAVGGSDGSDGDFRSTDFPFIATLELERVATGLRITQTPRFSSSGTGNFTVIDTTPVTYTFNAIGFGNIDDFRVDGITVETNVPEPASLGLLALGAGALVQRRRA